MNLLPFPKDVYVLRCIFVLLFVTFRYSFLPLQWGNGHINGFSERGGNLPFSAYEYYVSKTTVLATHKTYLAWNKVLEGTVDYIYKKNMCYQVYKMGIGEGEWADVRNEEPPQTESKREKGMFFHVYILKGVWKWGLSSWERLNGMRLETSMVYIDISKQFNKVTGWVINRC